ncbi:histone-lysine N-methyltransferase SETDB2 isoform X3 [Nomascus leucogenys]|nr:histone-lysine N-methyltransferase SETDB2 isoform X3 [Nomascus leucogenys]
MPVTQKEQENKSNAFPSTSYENSFPEDSTFLTTENKEIVSLEDKVDFREKDSSWNLSYQSHDCSGACLMKMPLNLKGENPLQLPIKCHFQRRHAKTNSHSSALHVSYKTPCGRSLRNVEEVFRYLLETECNFLFTDNFSFNTYVQLARNYPKQKEVVSDVDISNGVESVPISFCNEIDSRKLPQFKYRKTVWPRAYYLTNFSSMFTDSCDCSEGCIDITKCACLQLTARNAKTSPLSSDKITTGYKYKRLQRQIPTGIYECSLLCKCNRQLCQNRVVQHGPQVRLQVFKTEQKGWGVRCLDDIDRGTFVCIYSGRLLSRANTEKSNGIDENGRDENTMKNIFSKKRKLEVACSDCEVEVLPLGLETHPRTAKTEKCPPKFSNNPKELTMETKYDNISRIRYHSVIRDPESKTAIFQHNGKKMEFVSSESVTPEDNDGFKPPREHLNSKTKGAQKDSSSNHVDEFEDNLLIESDVIDITKYREETPPRSRCNQATTLDNHNIKKAIEVQIQKPQEGRSTACQRQQVFCDEELLSETKNTSSDSLTKFNEGNVFLLDATKEGNVGRFLNHSCCPNLLVQNVFVETHNRNFPLVAFFTNSDSKRQRRLKETKPSAAGALPGSRYPAATRSCSTAMAQASPLRPRPERVLGASSPEAQPAQEALLLPTGVFQVAEKMEKRTCALCPEDVEYNVLYFAQSENIAAHENCLLYSSGLVECEDHDPLNADRSFDVESVKKEIQRGRKLKCKFCHKRGATVGCDLKNCNKNYHFFCAKKDHAVPQSDGVRGIYKLLCQQHAQFPIIAQSGKFLGVKRKRGRKKHLSGNHIQPPETMKCNTFVRQVKEEHSRHTDATVQVPFLKKCKEAGLLNYLLEEILDKVHSIPEKLMDETTSESDYEEIGSALFDCRLFEDTFVNFQAAIEKKIHASQQRRQQLKEDIELLQDLKQTLCSFQEKRDLMSSSTSISSLSY